MQTEATQLQIKKKSERTQQNQTIFSISLIVVQTLLSIMYGLYCQTPIQAPNLSSVLSAIFFAFLVVGGFGLYFSYLKSLLWSGIAFSFLIIALSIQIYPLVNALWAKTHIHTNAIFSDSFRNKNFGLFLTNMDSKLYQGNTIISAIKCALALIVAFGSVIGRVGPLECLMMTVFGIFIYELNRSIIANIGQDLFGTFSIFTFGGFLGLTFGIFMALRERRRQVLTWKHPLLTGASQNISHVLIGGLLIFALFPFLAFEGDKSYASNLFQRYNTPVSIILSMGSAIYTSIGLSMLIYGDNFRSIRVKDVMNALIAGAIANGAASSYVTSPFLAITVGSVSSIIQYAFDNLLQKRIYRKFGLLSTHSFTLFCLQSLLGAFFAEGFNKRIVNNNPNNGFTYNPNTLQSPGNQIIIYFISAGLGIACGIITGIPSYFLNHFKTEQLFNDKTSFRAQDGIHFHIIKQTPPPIIIQNDAQNQIKQVLQSIKQIEKVVKPPQTQIKQQEQLESSSSEISFDFVDMLQVVIQ